MKDTDIRNAIRRLLTEIAALDIPVDTVADDTNLRTVGLASVTSLSLVLAIEDEFHIEIPDALLNGGLLQTIDSIAFAVDACLMGTCLRKASR